MNENQQPAQGAEVRIIETGQSRITGKNGQAIFRLDKGQYTVKAEQNGMSARQTVRLHRNVQIKLVLKKIETLREIIITATRAAEDMPVTRSSLNKKQIDKQYVTQDVPYLLEHLPSVVVTSDPGHGVGYTGIRIRGISPQQINVTLNGIPLNDPESHSVYWVDIPDFISSTENIQVQRGVGTSTYGSGAFGANINLRTEKPADSSSFSLASAFGSFNTQKITLKANTGLINNAFSFNARASKLHSDGYIDRAFADMESYFFSGLFKKNKHAVEFIHFGGHERTYQAWYGVDKETFEKNPTFNYAGAVYDDHWNIIRFYDNEVDDYTQKHYQLHYNFTPSGRVGISAALHYIKGYGYYEQYKQNQDFSRYGLPPLTIGSQTIDQTDLIRRKWLDNDFFGATANARWEGEKTFWIFGAGVNRYLGAHFGRVIWARFAGDTEIRHEYYRNLGDKRSFNAFVKNVYTLNDKTKLFTDIQIRSIYYNIHYNPEKTFDPDERIDLTDRLFFVNPKIGITYKAGRNKTLYLALAQTHREPNRTDYVENASLPQPETLNNIETGWRWTHNKLKWNTNLFFMFYKNQLVYTGRIDEVGNPIRENVGKSYRAGWENEWAYRHNNWNISAHLTLSRNKNIDYQAWDGSQVKNFGNTTISFSPSVTGGMKIDYRFTETFSASFSSKYVGKQYMDNRNIPESELPAYTISGLDLYYTPKIPFADRMQWHLKINNLFNKKYASNGYMWGDTPYYFPQAGRHFYLGLTLSI